MLQLNEYVIVAMIFEAFSLKELRHGWRIMKKLDNFFKFAIRNPPSESVPHPQSS